ncbi:MAG: DUF5615 family PIN-like protein [Chloroflexota bacterium]|nr:DUF5615 family PIN-like protein [Chloroflexota bacterium]
MTVRFLLDENLDPKLKIAILRLNPAADVLRVGDHGVPPLSTADPDLLRFCEVAQRILVTADRTTMPDHIDTHVATGGHLWGVCLLRARFSLYRIAQEVILIAEASTIEEWFDRIEWIPF